MLAYAKKARGMYLCRWPFAMRQNPPCKAPPMRLTANDDRREGFML